MPEPKLGESRTALDIAEIIASRRFARFQLGVLLLCGLVLFAAGFITQVMPAVGPALARSLSVAPGALGPIYSFGGYGTLLGILVLGPVADWIGRKPVLVGSLLVCAIFTFSCIWAQSVTQFAVLRFVAGLGLGGVVPSTLALAAEYMPKRHRATHTLLAWYGFAIGAGVAGPVASYTLVGHRWPVVFVFGGLMPVVLLPLVWAGLPESLLILIRRGERENVAIRAGLIRISRRYDRLRVSEFMTSEPAERGVPVLLLFRQGRALITALLWILFFMGLMTIFFVNAWLPTVLKSTELSDRAATNIAAVVQVGGMLGGLVVSLLAERFNRFLAVGGAFVLGALSIAAMGMFSNTLVVAIVVFLVGLFALGAQNAATAIAAAVYPTAMRATGVGWALGLGRNGQLISPTIGGLLVTLKWEANHLLYLVALPAFVAAAAAIAIAFSGRRFGDE